MRFLAFLLPGLVLQYHIRRRNQRAIGAAKSGGRAAEHQDGTSGATSSIRREAAHVATPDCSHSSRGGGNATRQSDLGVAASDLVIACDHCGSSVAIDRSDYAAARSSGAEVICPNCDTRRRAAAEDAARHRGYESTPNDIAVVVVDSPAPVIVFDDSVSVLDVGSSGVDSFVGGDGDSGGGGSSDSY